MVKTTTLSLLSTDTGVGVGDLDAEDLGLLENLDALLAADVVGDLGSERAVVHEEELDIPGVGNDQTVVAVGEQVAGLLVGAVTDLGHGNLALEASADARVNTLGLPP